MKNLTLSLVSVSILGMAACSPPSPEEIAKSTAENTSALISEAGDTAQAVNGHAALTSLTNGLDASQGGSCGISTQCEGPKAPPKESFEKAVQELARFLQERILIEKNLESKDWFSATFIVRGEDVCSDGTYTPPASCVEQVNKMELRVKAWPHGKDQTNLELLVSKDRFQFYELQLGKHELALISNLESAKKSLDFITSVVPNSRYRSPRVMQGKVELRLKKNGTRDFTLSHSVLADVRIEAEDAEGKVRTFQTKARSPVIAWRIDAPNKRLSFDLDFGETKYTFPYTDVSESATAGTTMTLLVSGMSMSFSAEEGKDDLVVGRVSLGTAQSYLDLDGKKLVTADLNALSNRRFSLNVSRGEDGLPVIRALPEFDLSLGFFLEHLQGDGNPPSFLLNETYRVRFTGGGSPTVKPVRRDDATGFPGGLKILSGSLTLSSDKEGVAPVEVHEGQCVGTKAPGNGEHPVIGMFTARPCP